MLLPTCDPSRLSLHRQHAEAALGVMEGDPLHQAGQRLYRGGTGLRGLEQRVRSVDGQVRIESTQEIKDFHASGDTAYAWSHLSVSMTSPETGAKTERSGHVLTVFRKSPSGAWLLARDANLMMAG